MYVTEPTGLRSGGGQHTHYLDFYFVRSIIDCYPLHVPTNNENTPKPNTGTTKSEIIADHFISHMYNQKDRIIVAVENIEIFGTSKSRK